MIDWELDCLSFGTCGDLGKEPWPLSLPECGFPGGTAALAIGSCVTYNITDRCAPTSIAFDVQKTDFNTENLVSRSSEHCTANSVLYDKFYKSF